METLIYLGGPLHGQELTIGEEIDSRGAIDGGHWYARRTVDFRLPNGGAASCDFLVHGSLDDAQAMELARPRVLASIAAEQAK